MEGPAKEIKRVWDKMEDESDNGLLSAIAPLKGSWEYNEAIDHWGTKWDIQDHSLTHYQEDDSGIIEGYFESAWGPPTEAIAHWLNSNDEHKAHILWYEPGNDFCGSSDNGEFEQFECSAMTDAFLTQDKTGIALDEAFSIQSDREEWAEEDRQYALSEPLTLLNPEEEPQ